MTLNDVDVIVVSAGAIIRSSRSSIAMNTIRAMPTGSTVGDYKARMRRLRMGNWVQRTIVQALDEGTITLVPGAVRKQEALAE